MTSLSLWPKQGSADEEPPTPSAASNSTIMFTPAQSSVGSEGQHTPTAGERLYALTSKKLEALRAPRYPNDVVLKSPPEFRNWDRTIDGEFRTLWPGCALKDADEYFSKADLFILTQIIKSRIDRKIIPIPVSIETPGQLSVYLEYKMGDTEKMGYQIAKKFLQFEWTQPTEADFLAAYSKAQEMYMLTSGKGMSDLQIVHHFLLVVEKKGHLALVRGLTEAWRKEWQSLSDADVLVEMKNIVGCQCTKKSFRKWMLLGM